MSELFILGHLGITAGLAFLLGALAGMVGAFVAKGGLADRFAVGEAVDAVDARPHAEHLRALEVGEAGRVPVERRHVVHDRHEGPAHAHRPSPSLHLEEVGAGALDKENQRTRCKYDSPHSHCLPVT